MCFPSWILTRSTRWTVFSLVQGCCNVMPWELWWCMYPSLPSPSSPCYLHYIYYSFSYAKECSFQLSVVTKNMRWVLFNATDIKLLTTLWHKVAKTVVILKISSFSLHSPLIPQTLSTMSPSRYTHTVDPPILTDENTDTVDGEGGPIRSSHSGLNVDEGGSPYTCGWPKRSIEAP